MEPGVPFALLGAVALLAVAAWVGLGVVALARANAGRSPALLLAVGGLVLATVEVLTATGFGKPRSDLLPTARAAGLLLLAAGLYAGALARRPRRGLVLDARAATVVVPLASAPVPAVLAATAALAAVVASLRARRDAPGLLLAAGLLLAGAAAGLGPVADGGPGALAVVALRGASALLLLAALLVLARSSLLGKVVSAVLAGVLVMAVAAVGVVGTVVADGAVREQNSLVADAALGRLQLIAETRGKLQDALPFVAGACRLKPAACAATVNLFSGPGAATFAVQVPRTGDPVDLGGRAALSDGERVVLAGSQLVELTLAGGPGRVSEQTGVASVVRLVGATPGLALVAALPAARPTPQDPAPSVFLYGIRLDDSFVNRDSSDGGFGLSLLVGGRVVASNTTGRARERLARIALDAGVADGIGANGLTVSAGGDDPSVSFRTLPALTGEPVGVIALSRSAEASLGAQRDALRSLLLTAVLATAVVGGLALVLGRRTVEPVRRLTAAAERVAAGDLTVTTGLTSRDEVGTLSRSFDAMTGSVSRLTGDLRASAARLETVLSSMTDGLVAADADGLVTSVNRAALAMAGLSEGDALGRLLTEVVDLRAGGVPLLPVVTGADVPAEVHRADGTTVPVRVAVAPLEGGDGIVLVLRDTTREREVERMKTDFLSNVSHELRTPLTPIRGYAEILVAKPGLDSDKVTRFATTIRDESIKLNRVVDLLVDVAAIEAGRVTIVARPVAPAELVDGRLAAWRSRAPERAGDLRRRVAAALPLVEVDPAWLGKALDELIDNALKYTRPGTAVTFTAALNPTGDRVRVGVRDAGPGIAEADQSGLFLSFEQVDGSATRRVGGLGLGLSFVRRLADDAGFVVSVTTAVGKGSEFALDLPLAPATPAVRRTRRPVRSPAS